MNFGQVLETGIKQGLTVTRKGWYGKHYLQIVDNAICFARSEGKNESVEIKIDSFIAIFPEKGGCIPWLCSQADALACDWEILKENN